MALVVLVLATGAVADFAQWDNLEVYLPWILSGHRRLLHGDFPAWNQFQNLGEPLHAMGPGGVFYLPYTICTLLVDAVGANPRAVMNTIAAAHLAWAGLGLYRLCRSFGVRPLFAMIAGIGLAMSGFALTVGAVWIHVLPILAWSAWALWAAKELIDAHRARRAVLVLTLSLASAFWVGHVQAAFYLWVFTGLFAACYAIARRSLLASAPWLLAAALSAALLSMPQVMPSAALLPDSDRATGLPREEFGVRGVALRALPGLLLPSYGGNDGFLEVGSLSTTHCGAWVLPSLLCAWAAWTFTRRKPGRKRGSADGESVDDLFGSLALNGGLAVLVLLLSLGDSTPFYGWTYGIPLWSSFRWPFKLFQHVLPFLLVAGALALEILTRQGLRRWMRALSIAAAVASAILWVLLPGLTTLSAIAAGVAGIAATLSLAWLDRPWGRAWLTCAVVLEVGSLLFLTHRPERFKTYAGEKVGDFGPGGIL